MSRKKINVLSKRVIKIRIAEQLEKIIAKTPENNGQFVYTLGQR